MKNEGKKINFKTFISIALIAISIALICRLFIKNHESQEEPEFMNYQNIVSESQSEISEAEITPETYDRSEWERPDEQVSVAESAQLNHGNLEENSSYSQYLEMTGAGEPEEESDAEDTITGEEHTILGMMFTPCDYYVSAKAVVNTRMEPSTEAHLGDVKLKKGQEVHVITESDLWLQIELDQNTYYIRRDTVRNNGGQDVQDKTDTQ